MYRIFKQKKIPYSALLLRSPQKIFHTQDLGVLWNIRHPNTLYTTIKRYRERGLLIPLHKGLYSTIPQHFLPPLQLASKALHSYAYLSCEWVLAKYGFMNPHVATLTFVGSVSRQFLIAGVRVRCRRLKEDFLFHPAGIRVEGGILQATVERAIADLLYFNPHAHVDAPIPWKRVRSLQREIGYPLTPHRYAHPAPGRSDS